MGFTTQHRIKARLKMGSVAQRFIKPYARTVLPQTPHVTKPSLAHIYVPWVHCIPKAKYLLKLKHLSAAHSLWVSQTHTFSALPFPVQTLAASPSLIPIHCSHDTSNTSWVFTLSCNNYQLSCWRIAVGAQAAWVWEVSLTKVLLSHM